VYEDALSRRKPIMRQDEVDRLLALYKSGKSIRQVADALGRSYGGVHHRLRMAEILRSRASKGKS
jgi:hypothetical protein